MNNKYGPQQKNSNVINRPIPLSKNKAPTRLW